MKDHAFVARDQELARLHEHLGNALDVQGQICMIAGEAGSGKTTLINEFVQRSQKNHDQLLTAIGT